MKEVIIATKNRGKAKEFENLFGPHGYVVRTLHDYPEIAEIEETGATFAENAVLKAESVAKALGKMVIADDSGLIVDALGGKPGIFSARYAGEEKNDDANIDKVLAELSGIKEEGRTARFYCALAVARPGHPTETVSGTCDGLILFERTGTNGFGYDPIFFVKEKNKAMAELEPEEKNQISHRARALQKLGEMLATFSVEDERA
ncbi:non-canonical purine NTP pyrophosphatase [Bacillus canaveralius]|uniref:dITP/XTP pyrophosphatase n=1 Tax=Bacillus canaveralius TaxID=1403243 RepID=A0A2N5GQ72_9BACI|nr:MULTISPECIES: XTP/dITP diphosphatase [Bacillus]PLR83098.1 non-canonical purine NTP pyrophosphatase [Bacillus sp. V33-4]PLR85026.1 non-canonical purine NTP pyrophosphatase [Bacillus canaveralius]PLR93287.1 non-canonical purine NTP pyrophosphatase [Bacillus canaveralius]RSK52486.1 XTP/dITP diphosphatase [Bacillus canaveralius]